MRLIRLPHASRSPGSPTSAEPAGRKQLAPAKKLAPTRSRSARGTRSPRQRAPLLVLSGLWIRNPERSNHCEVNGQMLVNGLSSVPKLVNYAKSDAQGCPICQTLSNVSTQTLATRYELESPWGVDIPSPPSKRQKKRKTLS